jgi:hypothetical protein
MTDPEIISGITAGASLIVALVAGGFAIWNTSRANVNATQMQDYKSAVDRDLARLNAKLTHGQLISSTQWNAELSAYQELWKSIVPVRTIARKIVLREAELTFIGLEPGDVSEENKIVNIQNLLHKYATKSSECSATINEHAPFYAADIRKKANEVHALAHQVFQTNLAIAVARQKGQPLPADVEAQRQKELYDFMAGTDALEEMIRKRMSEVQVLNTSVA